MEVTVDPANGDISLEVDDDQTKHTKLSVTNAALLVTVNSIGGWHVLDTSLEEEVKISDEICGR